MRESLGWGALYQQTPPIGQVPNAPETVYLCHVNYLRTPRVTPERLDRYRRATLKAYVVDSPAGLFLLEKTGKIAEKALFPRNPKDAAVKLNEVRQGQLPPEFSEFANRLSQMGLEKLTVDNEYLARILRAFLTSEVVLDERDETISKLRNRLPNMLVRFRIVESKADYVKLVHDVSLEMAQASFAETGTMHVLKASQTGSGMEDLRKVL